MKKVFNSVMIVAMLVWALGGIVVAPMSASAASAGSLIKMAGNPAVYYLGADSKRYVFPNQPTYNTWYGDFSGVVTISDTEMYSYSIGGNVTFRPGTKLVKITTDPKVYAVEAGGVLRHVPSEAVAVDLFGANWNKQILDLADAFFAPPTYTIGAALTTMYPTGSLVKEAGSATVYYIDGNYKRPIADAAAMTANKFRFEFVQTHSLSGYTAGTSITGAESAITTVAGAGAVIPSTTSTGTLTVALASDTPMAATVVAGAINVKFTKVNLTATGGDVTIDSMTIKRTGLAQDENLSNVYLLDSTGSMVGNEKTLGSTHEAVVNDDILVSNGTTKSYWLAATIAAVGTANSGEVPQLGLSAVAVKGTATVIGTLPIYGNGMTINTTIVIGTITVSDGGLATTGATTTKPVGTTNYTLSSLKLAANSTEDMQVERIRWYQSGTAADADFTNLKMLVDGVVLATAAKAVDKYVDFDLSAAPLSITKGNNKTFELKGDLASGSSRTADFEVYNKADILVKGKTYGFYVTPAGYGSSAPYWTQTAVTQVGNGTLTVSKATLPSTTVAEGATQQALGVFSFNAQGENIIITKVILEVTTTTDLGDITSFTLYDENGVVVAGPQDWVDAVAPTVTMTDTFTVPIGIHKYTVKGDLDSNFVANDTVSIHFASGPDTDLTAKGETTNNTITPTPSSEITGDTVTIKTGDLNVSVASSPAAQTVAAGTSAYIFANFVLDATQSGEDVKVTQLKVKHTTSLPNITSFITGITLYDGSTALNTPQAGESSTGSSATSTITLTNPLIITKGTAKTLVLKGDLSGSAADATTHSFGLVNGSVTAYGSATSNSITPDYTQSHGQAMTVTTGGTLRLSEAGSNPAEGLVIADTTNTIGVFNFEAQYENIEVQKVGLTISSGTNSYKDIYKLQLFDGATNLGEIEVTGDKATITPASLIIPLNTTKVLTLKAITQKVGPSQSGTSGNNFIVTVTGMDVKGVSTGVTTLTKNGLDTVATNAQYNYMTKPTVTKVSLSGMANGTEDLYKFTLAADSKGEVGFYKATFAITTSSATVSDFKFYEIDGSTETDLSNVALDASELMTANTLNAGGKFVINALIDTSAIDSVGGEMRSIGAGTSKTYVLRGDVTGWDANASIQVQLLGDNAVVAVSSAGITNAGVAGSIDAAASDNFIWSDLNYGYTSTTATTTKEWTNGYKILATTTQNF